MDGFTGPLLVCLLALTWFLIGISTGVRIGRKQGQRLEVREMIDLMEALQIDSWDQRVFRDRFVKALRWTLTKRPKREVGDGDGEGR